MRRFNLVQKAEPKRRLGEGVLFGGGRVAVMDYAHETVLPYRSLEHLGRERVVAFEIEWLDGAEEAS